MICEKNNAFDRPEIASEDETDAGRKKAKPKPTVVVPETEELAASIERFEIAYDALGGDLIDGTRGFSDECHLTIFAQIETIGRKHRHLIGQPLELTLICSRTFDDQNNPFPCKDPKFLMSLHFDKTGCSAGMYLDTAPFWATPALLASKAYGRIEIGYKRWPRYRSAGLEAVSFRPAVSKYAA